MIKEDKNKIKILERPSQGPDLNHVEILCHDLQQAVHA